MNTDINIVIASDNYYFPYVYVAVKTLFEHSDCESTLIVHYINQDVDQNNLGVLQALASPNKKVEIIDFDIPDELEKILPAYGKASKTTYAKFWFASMFPDLDRVLYLDPDVLVLHDLAELYKIDFEGNLIAGVIENLPEYHRIASKMGIEDSYINGGMILCNLDAWREDNLEQRALERLSDVRHNLNYDQGIINELCCGKIKVLPPKYNALAEVFEFKNAERMKKRYGFKHFYNQKEIDVAMNDPTIIHFTVFLYGKPMSTMCTHPYSGYFREQLKNAPFDFEYTTDDINIKLKIRKWVLHNLPFGMYLFLEKMLDVHRERDL